MKEKNIQHYFTVKFKLVHSKWPLIGIRGFHCKVKAIHFVLVSLKNVRKVFCY